MMYKNKTTQTSESVSSFIESVADPAKKADCYSILEMMERKTGSTAKMWGTAVVGFGSYHYTYPSGHQGNAPLAGFSPRSAAIVLYLASDFPEKESLLKQLGKHKTGVGCLYIKKLEQVSKEILEQLIVASVSHLKRVYPEYQA
ncbi:MAG: DUF1801 domain-containing protein [Bacteroidota bacterium]